MCNHVLLEIGMEELPARFIDDAEQQLKSKTLKWLETSRIPFGNVTTYSTPRRLAILIKDISETQTIMTEEARGPQVKIAKDEQGNWTKAAIGFTKGHAKELTDIYTRTVKGNEYIFVEKTYEGKLTESILPELKTIIDSLHFPQTMRWGDNSYRFARPIRWIVAMYNNVIIPFETANVVASNITFGHRFLGKQVIITDPLQYEEILEKECVIADSDKREQIILAGIKQIEEKEGFYISVDEGLLKEVRNLIEYPTVFYGSFSEDYLTLPKETLITSMKEHQRYFPVLDKDKSTLLPYFVSVRNGDEQKLENVVRGNEKVLRARLADAAFFYDEDKKQSIDYYMNKLKTVVFQEKIGTIYEKSLHVKQIASYILEQLEDSKAFEDRTLRTAEICKFDLMTNMVNEFTELQGTIGEKYARYFGEDKLVAKAIREHYLPLQANGELPETNEGAIVSVADKLDTIVSCFSVGLIPTGSQDPYGLRRQATGILRIFNNQQWNIKVEDLISFAESIYQLNDPEIKVALQQFFRDRATYLLSEKQISQDVIKAVLAKSVGFFHYSIEKAQLLSEKKNDVSFKETEEALVRIMNLNKNKYESSINPSLFQTESEVMLHDTFQKVKTSFEMAEQQYDAAKALKELTKLTDPIHQFFEHNMVMANDESIKENRLAVISHISTMIHSFADFTLIEWKQHH